MLDAKSFEMPWYGETHYHDDTFEQHCLALVDEYRQLNGESTAQAPKVVKRARHKRVTGALQNNEPSQSVTKYKYYAEILRSCQSREDRKPLPMCYILRLGEKTAYIGKSQHSTYRFDEHSRNLCTLAKVFDHELGSELSQLPFRLVAENLRVDEFALHKYFSPESLFPLPQQGWFTWTPLMSAFVEWCNEHKYVPATEYWGPLFGRCWNHSYYPEAQWKALALLSKPQCQT